jgi:glutaredoxin
MSMSEIDVVVYTQPVWTACHQETEFLSQSGVKFTEKNIAENDKFVQELNGLGSQLTPTTVIDGEVIVGFNRTALKKKLGL